MYTTRTGTPERIGSRSTSDVLTHYYRPHARPFLSLSSLSNPEVKRDHPHYFVLGEFSLWESDGSLEVQIPLSCVPDALVSFTLTDSFFNYRTTNLRGVMIPRRPYHGELFTRRELPEAIRRHGLPGDAWRTDPQRVFDVYVEAQLWGDGPVQPFLAAARR